MEQIYRGTPTPECDFNKVALNLWKADSVFKQYNQNKNNNFIFSKLVTYFEK